MIKSRWLFFLFANRDAATLSNLIGDAAMHSNADLLDRDALFTEIEAADVLNISVRTLQAWRSRFFGPAFVRAGRSVRYRRRDLLTWIDVNTVRPVDLSATVRERP